MELFSDVPLVARSVAWMTKFTRDSQWQVANGICISDLPIVTLQMSRWAALPPEMFQLHQMQQVL